MRVSAAVVLQMHRDGYSDQQIADQTGADLDGVKGIITTHKSLVGRGSIPRPEERAASPDAVALLAWATGHPAAAVRRDGERALNALESLHTRYKAEAELSAVTAAVAELEQKLGRLRSREAELKGSRKRPPVARDYVPAEVRAWAQQAGMACPPAGIVPPHVVAAWRHRTTSGARQ